MNKVVVAAIMAVIIGVGLWFVLSSNSDNNNAPNQETLNTGDAQPSGVVIEVSYTSNGFEPREVTINAGDTVTWANEGGPAMRVASDDHPDHLDYPGLDQLDAGTSYSFTFGKKGTWGYHNHEEKDDRGTVTVN